MSSDNKKIFVGLSGGVDSAVSAALLQREGYDVTGVFIKIWSPEFLECTWREDRLDAKRVAAHLAIPFREIDLSAEYKDHVVRNMLDTYQKGLTPNPDVLCNKVIKFGAFARWAFAEGADMVATGHYARVNRVGEKYVLKKGIDSAKDQSYFLYQLFGNDLPRILFPVGIYTKPQIRALARDFRLPNAERPDSQGLCFVGDVSMPEFLARFLTLERGSVFDENDVVIGGHDGASMYTIGQRHGLHIAPEAPPGPYYVTKVDIEKNALTVSKNPHNTEHGTASLIDIHWINDTAAQVAAVSRYHAKSVPAQIVSEKSCSIARFSSPLQLTPGQSLVFYDQDICLGGAVIQSVGD